MLKIALGEFSEVLLGGQRVVPEILEANGLRFQFPEVRQALRDLTRATPGSAGSQ